jgi:hypothetical protein
MEPFLWIGGYILVMILCWFLLLLRDLNANGEGRGLIFFFALFWPVMVPMCIAVSVIFQIDDWLGKLAVLTKRKLYEYRAEKSVRQGSTSKARSDR